MKKETMFKIGFMVALVLSAMLLIGVDEALANTPRVVVAPNGDVLKCVTLSNGAVVCEKL